MHTTTGLRARMNGALRLLGAATGRPLVGPRIVGLEITHFCNLGCSFCESHSPLMPAPITKRRGYEGGRRAMDLETITHLSRSLAKLGVAWVEISGKGDPVVHPKLPEVLRTLKQAGLRCSLFTTGSVPRADLAGTLVDCGLDRLNVSLNAASPEVWARIAGKDLWDRALGFLKEVLELRGARGASRPWVRASFVVCRDNVQDVEASVELFRTLGVDEGGWCVMGELPETSELQIGRSDIERLLAGVPRWKAALEQSGIVHDLDDFADDLRTRLASRGHQDNPLQRDLPCYEGWMHTVIGPDGAVAPCCYCDEVKLGNVVDQDFAEVWRGAAYQDFRRRSLAMPRTGEAICRDCFTSCNRAHANQSMHQRLGMLTVLQPRG